jgi:thioester reductase-like protein
LIGGELLRALVALPVRRLWALVRPTSEEHVASRLASRLGWSNGKLRRLEDWLLPVAGDVSQPQLGLPAGDAADISRDVEIIIHSAAVTSFLQAADCRNTNVQGMEQLIAFARNCTRKPLIVYVSTATNCGDRRDACLSEDQGGQPDAAHYNDYTWSKARAEQLLQESGLPFLIVRPSIVLSTGLADRGFAMRILWCVPVMNLFGALPVNPESRLDIVTVGFVVESLIRLLQLPQRRHHCYHLSAGEAGALSCVRLARFLDDFYQRTEPLVFLPPGEWTPDHNRRFVRTRTQRAASARLRHYLPFLNMNTTFDNRRLRAELSASMPPNPDPISYLAGLVRQFSVHDVTAPESSNVNPAATDPVLELSTCS